MRKLKEKLQWWRNSFTWKMKALKFRLLMKIKEFIYNWEFNEFQNTKFWSVNTRRTLKYSVFMPVSEVIKTIETVVVKRNQENGIYPAYPSYNLIMIKGINVDTQGDTIKIELLVKSPGSIIGKRGTLFDKIKKELEWKFNAPVEINLKETGDDINQNLNSDCW